MFWRQMWLKPIHTFMIYAELITNTLTYIWRAVSPPASEDMSDFRNILMHAGASDPQTSEKITCFILVFVLRLIDGHVSM